MNRTEQIIDHMTYDASLSLLGGATATTIALTMDADPRGISATLRRLAREGRIEAFTHPAYSAGTLYRPVASER